MATTRVLGYCYRQERKLLYILSAIAQWILTLGRFTGLFLSKKLLFGGYFYGKSYLV